MFQRSQPDQFNEWLGNTSITQYIQIKLILGYVMGESDKCFLNYKKGLRGPTNIGKMHVNLKLVRAISGHVGWINITRDRYIVVLFKYTHLLTAAYHSYRGQR